MKQFKNISFILVAVATLFACNKKLDVLPQQNITPDQIKTASDVKALLFGGYKLMQTSSAFGEQYILMGDLIASASQVDFVGTFTDYRDVQNKTMVANNNVAETMWANSYTLINTVNTVLDKIDLLSDDEKDAISGEAKFMRGVALFELVNYYAQPYSNGNAGSQPGVPIITQPVYAYDASKDNPARATVEAVYQQVISDLTDAFQTLPDAPEDFRAGKYSAEAFLARVYMNMANYTQAAQMADDVINNGGFALASSFDKCFNNVGNSSEDIYAIQQTSQSNAGTSNGGLTTFYAAQPTGRGDAQINQDYFSFFNDDDARLYYQYEGVSIGGFSGYYTRKWEDFYKTIPVVRLAEMYLTRGEANLRSGEQVGDASPADDLNMVRSRAGTTPIDEPTEQDFVDERLRELGFEGDRMLTLKRLQLDVDGFAFDDPKLIFPIPQREMDVNKNLTQNPGY